jgi:hypothetical protein
MGVCMDAFDIRRNQDRLRGIRNWRIVKLLSLGLTLCFILILMILTLQTVPTGKQEMSAMDFPNQILRGSLSRAMKFGGSLKNILPLLREDSSVTEVKDTVVKPDSSPIQKPRQALGKKLAQSS